MNTIESKTQEQKLDERERELDKRGQKLDAYALELKKEKQELDKNKSNYQDELNATFNDVVNKAIQKQRDALLNEQKIMQDEKQEYFKKQLELEKEENDLKLERERIENEKKELHIQYTTQLEEEKRKKLAEFVEKLEEEFAKQFKDKITELNEREKALKDGEYDLRLRKDKLEQEKHIFERKFDERKFEIDREEYNKCLEEYKNLRTEYGEFERFKDRNLIEDNTALNNEVKRLRDKLEDENQKAEERITKIRNKCAEAEKFYYARVDEIEKYEYLGDQLNTLKAEKKRLEVQLEEQGYYEKLYNMANDRLKHLQSQFMGKEEQQKREDAIKHDYILATQLCSGNKNTEEDEIKWLANIETNMEKYGLMYPQRLLYAFHTALKTASMSPLSVLSGVSGTGKSELPKLYAYFGGFNFLSEAVQPTWDSPASMVGFYNTIEGKFDSTNLFKFLVQTSIESKSINEDKDVPNEYGLKESMNLILLDELNLAHIELYFAEFLSKFEIKRGSDGVNLDIPIGAGLTMPIELDSNLLWVGTMNEDETTKSLSDKVLDRAFCLNFPRPKELVSRLELKKLNEIHKFKWLPKTTWERWIKSKKQDIELKEYQKITEQINEKLSKAHRAIGHRVWQSMEAYMLNYPHTNGDREKTIKIAFEDAVVQKIIPKLRGIELHGEEKNALIEIRKIIEEHIPNLKEDFNCAMNNPYGQFKFNSAYYLDSQKNTKIEKDKESNNE